MATHQILKWVLLATVFWALANSHGGAASAAATAQQDPWKVLGVRRSATRAEITRAFRRLSRQWHPDKNPSAEATERFQEISAAYEVLTDPKKAHTIWETSEQSPPGSKFSATFGTVQFVLDLDPNRLRELLTARVQEWAGNNWETVGPLWASPVDRSVCWCLENAWRLPKLTDPVRALLASIQGTKVREDVWRAWRLSGALLELTAWSSRQSPCLYHHLVAASSTSSSSPDEQQVLSQLQQQLQTRRKARQAAVEALQRRRKRQQRGGGSSSDDLDNDSPAGGSGVGGGSGSAVSWEFSAWQGCVVWGVVLAAAVGWSCARSSLVFTAPLVAAAAAVYAVASGVLLPSEAAVQQLAQVLDANGMQAALAGLAYVATMLSLGLLLPVLVAAALFLAITWVWAAASCCSIAMTPTLSQAGLALWMASNVYFQLAGAGDLIKSALVVLLACYGMWKVPGIFKWWGGLLFAPVIFLLSFGTAFLRACGVLRPAAVQQPSEAAQQAAAAAAEQRAAAAASDAADQAADQRSSRSSASPQSARAGSQQGHPTPSSPATAASATASAANGSSTPAAEADARPRRSRSSNSTKSKGSSKKQRLLPDGDWWPKSLRPWDLGVTAHWYTTLLGWHLPRWALSIAAISCKLTLCVVVFAVCAAAFSTNSPHLLPTLQTVVNVVLLRAGFAVGLLWRMLPVLLPLAKQAVGV